MAHASWYDTKMHQCIHDHQSGYYPWLGCGSLTVSIADKLRLSTLALLLSAWTAAAAERSSATTPTTEATTAGPTVPEAFSNLLNESTWENGFKCERCC